MVHAMLEDVVLMLRREAWLSSLRWIVLVPFAYRYATGENCEKRRRVPEEFIIVDRLKLQVKIETSKRIKIEIIKINCVFEDRGVEVRR